MEGGGIRALAKLGENWEQHQQDFAACFESATDETASVENSASLKVFLSVRFQTDLIVCAFQILSSARDMLIQRLPDPGQQQLFLMVCPELKEQNLSRLATQGGLCSHKSCLDTKFNLLIRCDPTANRHSYQQPREMQGT